jgi:hypothetical protein
MATYLLVAQGDKGRALALYEWNIRASGALYEALALVEVVLRNTIHDQLTEWHLREGRASTWLDDVDRLLEQRARDDIAAARRRVERWRRVAGAPAPTRRNPPAGAVVAELGFGFWRFLLASRYEHSLWLHALRNGFPGVRDRRAIEAPVRRLHEVRNRIAHLEPVLKRDLARDEADVSKVLRAICPDTERWATSLSRIRSVGACRP